MVDNRPDLVGDLMSQLGKNINFLSSTAAAASLTDRHHHHPSHQLRPSQPELEFRRISRQQPLTRRTCTDIAESPASAAAVAADAAASAAVLPVGSVSRDVLSTAADLLAPGAEYPRTRRGLRAQVASVSPFPQQQQQTSNGVPSPSRPPVYPHNAQMPPHQSGFPQQIPQQPAAAADAFGNATATAADAAPDKFHASAAELSSRWPTTERRSVYGPGPQQQQNYGGYQPSPPNSSSSRSRRLIRRSRPCLPPQMQPKRSSSGGHRAAGMPQVPQDDVPARPYMDPYGPQQQQQQHPPQGPMQQQPYGSGPQLGMGGQYPGPGGPIPGQQQQQRHHQQHQYHMHQQQQGQFRAPAPPGSPYSHPSPGGCGRRRGGSNGPGS
ncbi:hypothetical protein BV898_09255 [Hypsibius exemplaris]|nr:hypothetical protein BV898_09255 [Hypsibius exemplaris]